MSDRMYVATRKGLFTLDRSGKGWTVTGTARCGAGMRGVTGVGRMSRVRGASRCIIIMCRRCASGSDGGTSLLFVNETDLVLQS